MRVRLRATLGCVATAPGANAYRSRSVGCVRPGLRQHLGEQVEEVGGGAEGVGAVVRIAVVDGAQGIREHQAACNEVGVGGVDSERPAVDLRSDPG